jgi:UDP-GlcNAc:undecaprenyl-phosphate GlcNAc-1-phosphate transferase
MHIIFSILIDIIITWSSVAVFKWLAPKIHLIDEPNHRKKHNGNIPLVGGICIFLGFFVSTFTLPIKLHPYFVVLGASLIIVLMGVFDDIFELTIKPRLLLQLLSASLLVIFSHADRLTHLGKLFSNYPIHLGWTSYPLTVLGIVLIINAMNMLDGLDGLLGLISNSIIILLGIISLLTGHTGLAYLLLMLFISISVFLFYNFPTRKKSASIFFGDSGSMFLGLILAWFAIHLSQSIYPTFKPILLLWVFSIPIYDLINSIIRRLLEGSSPFSADRGHIHHLILDLGKTKSATNFLVCGLNLLFGLLGLLLNYFFVVSYVQLLIYIVCLVGYIIAFHLIKAQHLNTTL